MVVCKEGALAVKYGSMANDWTPSVYGFEQEVKSHLGLFEMSPIM